MSYPQPNFTQQVVGGARDAWRLFTEIASPGDIYESEQGALAFALGPESDFANIRITYFDNQGFDPPLASSFAVNVNRPWVGRISPEITNYSRVNKQGRLLITLDDIYDPSYRPTGFDNVNDRISFQVPYIDLLGFQGEAPSIFPARRDATYFFNNVRRPAAAADVTWAVYPYWGRHRAYWQYENFTADNITLTILGVSFTTRTDGGTTPENLETTLHSGAVAAGAAAQDDIAGFYDMIAVGITTGAGNLTGPHSFRMVASDNDAS